MRNFKKLVLFLFILTLGNLKATDGNVFASSDNVFSNGASMSADEVISPPPPPPDDGTDDGGGVVGTGNPVPIDTYIFILFGVAFLFIFKASKHQTLISNNN